MDHQRVGPGTLEYAVASAGERVVRHRIGEGKLVRRVQVVHVFAGIAARLCEPVVQDDAPAARHVRRDGVEDPTPFGVFVEASIDELTEEAAALGYAPGVGLVDAGTRLGEWVRTAAVVDRTAEQERHEIPYPVNPRPVTSGFLAV